MFYPYNNINSKTQMRMDYQMPLFHHQLFSPQCFHHFQYDGPTIQQKTFQLFVFVEEEKKVRTINIGENDLKDLGYKNKKKRWTQQEDQRLLKLIKKSQTDWEEISNFFPDRNPKMCYNRYRRLQCSIERSWTQEDDNKIIELVSKHGEDWRKIKQKFPKRNEKQLKDHYLNYLRPDIDKSQWSLETDLQFVRLLSNYGCDWVQIQKHMPQRPYPHIKNRYYGRIAKIIAKKLEELKE